MYLDPGQSKLGGGCVPQWRLSVSCTSHRKTPPAAGSRLLPHRDQANGSMASCCRGLTGLRSFLSSQSIISEMAVSHVDCPPTPGLKLEFNLVLPAVQGVRHGHHTEGKYYRPLSFGTLQVEVDMFLCDTTFQASKIGLYLDA